MEESFVHEVVRELPDPTEVVSVEPTLEDHDHLLDSPLLDYEDWLSQTEATVALGSPSSTPCALVTVLEPMSPLGECRVISPVLGPPTVDSPFLPESRVGRLPGSSPEEYAEGLRMPTDLVSLRARVVASKKQFLTAKTLELIYRANGDQGNTICVACKVDYVTFKRLSYHTKQHWFALSCSCGYGTRWREYILTHRETHRTANPLTCGTMIVHLVDSENYAHWKQTMHRPTAKFAALKSFEQPAPPPSRAPLPPNVLNWPALCHPLMYLNLLRLEWGSNH